MSMSTLGQQLAAINGPGKNAGSTVSTSKRHEDSIGRGLAHSVQVGHALHNREHQYKPSIIHENARKASDVPLATIRENCVTSLRDLENLDTEFGAFVGILCEAGTKERGLSSAAENDKIDKSVEDLLYRLSLVMGFKGKTKNTLVSCLNVIEFLLRKYDIHIRPKTASTMLLAMLPHHEEPYFLRVLQLIDLASLPEWAFLRPYAIPGARLGRSILAQKASKDVTLIRDLCHLSKRNSRLPFSQQSLSFTAAVLVEALTLQTHRKGSMEERTCQAILPFVVTACRNEQYYKATMNGNRYPDGCDGNTWRNWGYVMASTMVETGFLASEPRSLLVTSILQGLALQQEVLCTTPKKHESENSSGRRSERDESSNSISSGLIASFTILAQDSSGNTINKSEMKDIGSHLSLLSPSMIDSSTSMRIARNCGFSLMNKDIFNALLQIDGYSNESYNKSRNRDSKSKNIKNGSKSVVAACIANLYYNDGIVDFEHWIASILVFGWKRFVKYHKQTGEKESKRSRKARLNCCKILNLTLNLMKHSHLEKLWTQMDGQWIESFISFVYLNTPLSVFDDVKNDANDTKEFPFSEDEYVTAILQTLRSLDGIAYEKGLTHALIQTKSNKDRMNLAEHLGLAKSKQSGGNVSQGKNPQTASSINLPPRVGLEHTDCQIRLTSISSLLEEVKTQEKGLDIGGGDVGVEGENITQALFRRFLMDDNEQVALAAVEALDELLSLNRKEIGNDIGYTILSEGVLEALYKWTECSADEDKMNGKLLAHSCRLAHYAVKSLRASNQIDLTYVRLVEALGVLLYDSDDTVSLEASKGILAAFGQEDGSNGAAKVKELARYLLISNDAILKEFRRVFRARNGYEFRSRRRLSGVVLEAICTTDSSKVLSMETLEYSIWLLDVFVSDFSKDEIHLLGKSLALLASRLTLAAEDMHSTFCRLCSCEEAIFDVIAAPYIRAASEKIKDRQGGDVSPIAIIMETVLSSDSFQQIKNLLLLANEMASKDTIGNFYAIAPALALCCHHEERIRRVSVSFLSHVSKRFRSISSKDDWMVLIALCHYFTERKSSVVLHGSSFISESLATILSHSKEAQSIRKYLLQAILCSVSAYGAVDSVSPADFFAKSWMNSCNIIGGYRTGAAMLEVTEKAGEVAFPILSRWEVVGRPLLSAFFSTPSSTGNEVSCYQSQFIHSAIKILRGEIISAPSSRGASSTSTIITTGPSSHGRRARSYSFGKNDGFGALKPYPTNMQVLIESILTKKTDCPLHHEIQTCLFEIVLCSHSWRRKVFYSLNGKVRQKIASSMLTAATESLFQGVDSVLTSLPLDAIDIAKLLSDQDSSELGLSKLTFIADFINANHSKLAASDGTNELFASIFKKLAGFSQGDGDSEAIEFARYTLLGALLELIQSFLDLGPTDGELGTKKKTFVSWLNTLLDVQSTHSSNLVWLRSQRIIFLIFASLCDKYPTTVIPKLIPAIAGLVSESLSHGEENTLVSCFDLIIPAYFRHEAASNLSPIDLFLSFINQVCKYDEMIRPKFYRAFVHGLSMIPGSVDSEASVVGSFIAAVLARESYSLSVEAPTKHLFSKLSSLATQILSHTSSHTRLQAVWTMQNYAKEILFNILQEETTFVSDSIFPVQHLIEISIMGPNSSRETLSNQSLSGFSSSSMLETLCSLFVIVTCEVVTSHESRNIIRRTEGSGSAVILRVWQDLLLIQSACHNRLGGSKSHTSSKFLERIVEISTQALECIQNSIPSHIFLAFVTNLVTEGETQELRAKAVQLIAERSSSWALGQSEAELFVEMIPPLIQLLVPSNSDDKIENNDSSFLHQSVFAAIDSIGRNACLQSESHVNDRHLGIFSDAIFKATNVFETANGSKSIPSFLHIPSESRQLISSAALCSSTAINICGPRVLPVLPKLIKPLLNFLCLATAFIELSTSEDNDVDKKELSQAKLMQLAIVRTFRSIVERMPMLLQPYLVDILKTFSEVSGSIQGTSLNQSQSIQKEMTALQTTMTSVIPARQLVPSASKSILSTTNENLNASTLSIMTESIAKSKSSEVSGMISLIIKTATYIYDQDITQKGNPVAMEAADELLLSLVMKLSEVQLRSLYRKMREWRGDLDKSNPEMTGGRRSSFWRFSSTLSTQLKSIYLSCFTTVFSDAVDELEMAASYLSGRGSVKKSNGKKKQRLSGGEEGNRFQDSSIEALKNLLLCVEVSLRSDAHEGGIWIRELESQRFEKLLEPLGKLLHCRLPSSPSNITYETIVQGKQSQFGNVVECLVALATAAGDEQLWKPLNHSVLQACSDEDRLDVRKAGVLCLLSLINSIGEEYMVLIPECLPILSELLEDPDEEVASTAQECISQSEELLGESLQDSLR